jgi:DeoR family transcriptional regulator, catabolite repression regulator
MSTPRNESLLVGDVMLSTERFPVIAKNVILKEALESMGKYKLGIACIVDDDRKLLGVLTDGDIRRKLLKVQKPFSALFVDDALDHAIHEPATTRAQDTLVQSVELMGKKQIWDLPVVDDAGKLVGLLHLHPAVQALLGMRQ